jgi:hypothetical protein
MTFVVCCSKWRPPPGYRSKFEAESVNVLRAMVARHFPHPHEFVCITDDPAGIDPDIRIVPIWDDFKELRGPHGVNCYRRLRLFSREMAAVIGPRFVHLDLDVVITGDLRPLWLRDEDFVIWGDTARGTPYNGSMFLMTAGSRSQVWETFDPVTSPARTIALGYVGSDQAWIGACLGWGEAKWGEQDGVYSWRVHVKRKHGGHLPANARVVVFHGREDPWMPDIQAKHPWIAQHYRRG